MILRTRQLLYARSWCGCPVLLHPRHRLPLSRGGDPGTAGPSERLAAREPLAEARGGAAATAAARRCGAAAPPGAHPRPCSAPGPTPPAAAGAAALASVPAGAARYAAIKEVIMTNGADLFLIRSFIQMTSYLGIEEICRVSDGENRDLLERVSPVRWQPRVLMCCNFICICYVVVLCVQKV